MSSEWPAGDALGALQRRWAPEIASRMLRGLCRDLFQVHRRQTYAAARANDAGGVQPIN